LKEKGANSIVATAGIDKSDAMFIYLIKDNKKSTSDLSVVLFYYRQHFESSCL
jgi:hypothetical protein